MFHLDCCSSPRSVSETGIKEIRFFSHSFSNTMLYFSWTLQNWNKLLSNNLLQILCSCLSLISNILFGNFHLILRSFGMRLQSWAECLERRGEIQWGWTGQGKFDICFCLFFGSCCQGLISGGGVSLGCTQIWSFPNISLFPKILVVRQFVR